MTPLAIVLLLVTAAPQPAPAYAGRPLGDVLRALQAGGLRIVFSTEIVTPVMRVTIEPRSTKPREILDEVLKPLGLKAQPGAGGVIQIVRDKPARTADPKPDRAVAPPGTGDVRGAARTDPSYSEHVTVVAADRSFAERGGALASVQGRDLADLQDVLAGDPERAIQALPGVAAADDFRSEFSMRASTYRQLGIVIDGVPARRLHHAVYGAGNSATLGMMNGLVIDRAVLSVGAYPRLSGDWIGPELDLAMREGSRTAAKYRGALGGTSATIAGEGPLAGGRGAWLAAVRQGYREWPIAVSAEDRAKPFGFSDAQGKIVFDVRPGQQLAVTFLGGRSRIDERGGGAPGDLAVAANTAAAIAVAWRSTISRSAVVRQRLSVLADRFANVTQAGAAMGSGRENAWTYDGSVTGALGGGVAEAGVQFQRVHGERFDPALGPLAGSSSAIAGYVNGSWTVSRVTLTPGVRVTRSSLLRRAAISPWVLAAIAAGHGLTVTASGGIVEAAPQFDVVGSGYDPTPRAAERAVLVDAGIEQRLGGSLRWKATLFERDERDVALSGTARGLELSVERRSDRTVSGWLAYSFGRARQMDAGSGQSFWADFDRRHGVSAAGIYRLSDRSTLAVTFRGGSGFPLAGSFELHDGVLFSGGPRNEIRLPAYARLDVRAARTVRTGSRRVTLYAEVVNALNRRNVGAGDGTIAPGTGVATGFTRTLLPRTPSAGLLIEF